LAVSETDPSVFFAAIYDEIHVYRLNSRDDRTLEPIMKLLHPPHEVLGPAFDSFSVSLNIGHSLVSGCSITLPFLDQGN
jgi:hypothetical protein